MPKKNRVSLSGNISQPHSEVVDGPDLRRRFYGENSIMGRIVTAIAIAVAVAWAADAGLDLRNAAKKGQTAQVAALVGRGVPIDSVDKDGRTALMLAAQRGHAETVKLLLDRGAKADARDRQGWTAYALAVIEGRDDVVKLFPAREPLESVLDVKWAPDNVYGSCFLKPQQLAEEVAAMQPDSMAAAALRDYAALSGKGVARFVESGGAVTVTVKVRPGISCLQQQTLDNVSVAIDVRAVRNADQRVLLEKTFGGGLKGLKARTVSSPAQYAPLFSEWTRSHAPQIYWAIVEAWLRAR